MGWWVRPVGCSQFQDGVLPRGICNGRLLGLRTEASQQLLRAAVGHLAGHS